jgi:hypothetical protein
MKRRFNMPFENFKEERKAGKSLLTANYQLGWYVGLYIISNYLPTLSTDYILSRNVVQVSYDDTTEFTKLQEEAREDNEAFLRLRDLDKQLHKKYLPETLVCNLDLLNIENEEEFKKGLYDVLMDSDICSYNIQPENIKIYDDANYFYTIIEFTLDVSVIDESYD